MTYHRGALGSSATYVPTPDQTFAGVDPADYDAVVSFLKKHRRTMRVHVIRMSPDALSPQTLPQRKTGFDFVLDPNDTAGGGFVWSLKALKEASFGTDPDRGELYHQDKTYAWAVYDVDNAAPGFDGHARVGHGSFVVPARNDAEGPSPAVIAGGLALLACVGVIIFKVARLDIMSFYAPVLYTGGQGLGAAVSYTLPTNPPTPSDQVWAPPGIQYLEVDGAGNPRPEYAAITSALRIPGVGWTADDAKAGKVQLNQAKVFGPLTGDSIIKGWANAGLAVVYVASTLQAPDGFFMPIAMSNLLNNWANQLGVYLATMPYNGPMSKAGWGPYLTPGATGTVPVKPPPGGQVTPGQVTPPGSQINPAIPQVPPGGTPGSQVIPGPGSWVPWVPGTSPIQSMSKDTYDLVVGTLLGVGLVSGLAVIGYYVLDESKRRSAPVRARARVKDYGVRAGLRDETLFSKAEPFRGEYPVVRV